MLTAMVIGQLENFGLGWPLLQSLSMAFQALDDLG